MTAVRLLLTERDALLPILRSRPDVDFDLPTVLPGWSVRDVLAHCSAALNLIGTDAAHSFSPADNQVDVDHRRDWSLPRLLDELTTGYDAGAAAIEAAGGRLDGVALGEWTHGGDVRDAWGIADAYCSGGVDDALEMLARFSRGRSSQLPATAVTLTDRGELRLGRDEPVATLSTDTATFVRMFTGRCPDASRFVLTGADASSYVVFN